MQYLCQEVNTQILEMYVAYQNVDDHVLECAELFDWSVL